MVQGKDATAGPVGEDAARAIAAGSGGRQLAHELTHTLQQSG